MRSLLATTLTALLLSFAPADAQDARALLDAADKALGAAGLKSFEMTAGGVSYAVGQAQAPGGAWPRFNVKSLARSVNYETASLRDMYVRTQAETPPRGGGVQPVRGEQRQVGVVGGEHAWNVVGDAAVPAPIALAARQLELWATPPVTFEYADYKDFGGVKFPTKIRQTAGGFPVLDVTVDEVRPNASVDIAVPDAVREAMAPYAVVASQMVADGVWYVTGGTHHSVAIEMKDHMVVVEAPLNDQRALAVLAEVRGLAANKPVRYVINSHHHFDHGGGVRAFAAEGVTVITHEVNRAWWDSTLAARATVSPDHLTKSGKRPAPVEGVRDKRVLTDGARTIEIHHIAGVLHDDGLLMVYLPKERLLIEADAYTPPPPSSPPPSPPSPFTVGLVDNIGRLGLTVDRLLPLHGRIVPLADLNQAAGRAN